MTPVPQQPSPAVPTPESENGFAIARLSFSKGDLFRVEVVQRFVRQQEAEDHLARHEADWNHGSPWSDWLEYRVIAIRGGRPCWVEGGEIATVLD